jgi:lysophospholipase L1-like esterase
LTGQWPIPMNSNRRVLLFILYSTGIYLLLSVISSLTGIDNVYFNRINLVSDVLSKKDTLLNGDPLAKIDIAVAKNKDAEKEDFSLYRKPFLITDFNADTTQPSLDNFLQKLYQLKTTNKGKIRIAYFGDSMIEGDLLTQTIRKALQKTFGGKGVGFVPITSQVSQFRQTVWATYSPGWEDENFRGRKATNLYLSGHLFKTKDAWVQMKDQTVPKDSVVIEKSLLCGYSGSPVSVTVNDQSIKVNTSKFFSRIVLEKNKTTTLKLSVSNDQFPVYGLSFESENGVIVDNFSFRGITGIELAAMDSAFLKAINETNPYDLIVFQYGVNLLFRPNDKNFNWYARAMLPIIKKIKAGFPGCDFIVVSTADRAFSYNGQYKSAIGIDSLIKVQAMLAQQTNSSFYNLYQTMGGKNSIVDWAKHKPSLANKDYVHPNHRGAEILGNYFYTTIMNDYNKYVHSLKQ